VRIITLIVLLAASASTAFAQPTSPADPVAIKPSQPHADDTVSQSPDGGPDTVTLVGTLGVSIACDFENHRSSTEYSLQTDDGAIHPLRFSAPRRLTSGMRLRVTGTHVPDGFQVDAVTILATTIAAGGGENLGEQRTIVLLVNSTENAVQPITPSEAADRVFNATRTDSINSWVKEVSYQRAFLSGDVSGWYTLSLTRAQLCQQGGEQAILNAVDSFVNFSQYTRVIIVFPWYSSCGVPPLSSPYWGVATVGKTFVPNDGGVMLSIQRLNGEDKINGGTGVHELGHNFGVFHANAWDCGLEIITGSCDSLERLDPFDIMGGVAPKGHFNAMHKDVIGWFENNELLQVGNEHGTYVLRPIETSDGLKALKIPSDGFDFYIEYRRPVGYDNNFIYTTLGWGTLGRDVYRGAIIHTDVQGSNGDSQLLDMLPQLLLPKNQTANVYDIVDSVLEVGKTFSYNGLNLTPTKLNDTSLAVCVEFGGHFDADSDGVPDACDVCPGFNDAEPCPIPTISAWGLGILALSLLTVGTLVVARHRARASSRYDT